MRQMTPSQERALLDVLGLLRRYRRRSRSRLFPLLPYPVTWKRVTWKGGVGSWKLMRSGNLRIQVAASVSGVIRPSSAASMTPGGSLYTWRRKMRPKGWKYAFCVEIPWIEC